MKKVMYKQVKTTPQIILSGSRSEVVPIATLKSPAGGWCEIIKDDHCYLVCLQQNDGTFKPTPWIFKEAHEALKKLPPLTVS